MTYQRELLPHERRVFRGPNANVVLNIRIRGPLSADLLRAAVHKARQRHRLLDARIVLGADGWAGFTSVDAEAIVIRVLPRQGDQHWIQQCLAEYQIPHAFDRRPPIRFVLLQSPEVSDLIIVCHHMICDALSLAYLARDLLLCLGDPHHAIEVLPDPPLMDEGNIPANVNRDLSRQPFFQKLNAQWEAEEVLFDAQDFENIFQAYWANYTPSAFALEFSAEQTARLVQRSRAEQVTVNTTLLTALLAAQQAVQGSGQAYLHHTATAMDLRQHLIHPPGEAFGFYAGGAVFQFEYPPEGAFWDVARRLHAEIRQQLTPANVFSKILAFGRMGPTLLDGITFKRYSRLVQPGQSRYEKLAAFREREDTLAAYLQAEKKETVRVGLILSNLTRLDFPETYGPLTLERMMFLGAGTEAYEKAVGAVTVSGRLTLMLSSIEEVIPPAVMTSFGQALTAILNTETA